MQATKNSLIPLIISLFLASPVVAETTNSPRVNPSFGGGFTTTGVGYEEPYFNIEGFVPIIQQPGKSLTFFEGKLLWLTDSTMGGNLLLGQRFLHASDKEILGAYVAYDVRDTGNNVFHQIGFGLERLGDDWDFRVNSYLPVGNSRQQVGETIFGDWGFRGNFFGRDVQKRLEVAYGGVDVEAGVKLSRLGQGDLRGYAGVYYYGAEGIEDFFGVRGRLEARPTNNLRFGLMVQNDPQFDTTVVFNVGVNLSAFDRNSQRSLLARMGESVERTSTISVDETLEKAFAPVTNPATGKVWQFRHVNLGLGTGEGTFENPAGTIQGALNVARSGDIVYVASGSNSESEGFTVPDGVSVLSTALVREIDTKQAGLFQLPMSGNGIFPKVKGTAILGSNSTVSGFNFSNITGNAIQAASVKNVTIRDNQITNVTGQGISLSGVTGENLIENNAIALTGNQGIFLQGFDDNQQQFILNHNSISNSSNSGIFIQASENARQQVIARDTTVTNSIGTGIFLQANDNSQQKITLENTAVNSTAKDTNSIGGQGIFIAANGGAQQNVRSTNTTISDAASQGVFIAANGERSQQNIILDNSTVTRSGGQGIFIQGNGNVQSEVTLNQATASNTAKDSNGDGGQGIFVAANDGATSKLSLNSPVVTDNAAQGIFVNANNGAVSNLIVNNPTVNRNTGQGIFVQANNSRQELEINQGAVRGTTQDSNGLGGQGILISGNSGAQQSFRLNNTTVSDNVGQGIFISGNGDPTNLAIQTQQTFTINSPTINSNGGQGIFVQANGNVRQELAIANGKINNTRLDTNGLGGQGIFVQGNTNAQQKIVIQNNTVSDRAGQGIFIQTNGNSVSEVKINNNTIGNGDSSGIFLQANGSARSSVEVQLNALENQVIAGFSAAMNSDRVMCVGLRGNRSNTGFQLQRNAGTVQVVDRDNTGRVNYLPDVSSFTNVSECR